MDGPFSLSGRRVVVTGASSGIGEAVVRGFAAAGARVAGISLDDSGSPVGLPPPGRLSRFKWKRVSQAMM